VTTLFCVRPTGFNIGNDTIFLGLRHLVRQTFGSGVNLVHVPAVKGEAGSVLYGLLPQSIHQMNQYGHGVIVGGGNLYENGALDVNVHALGALRPPLMLFSLSHGRIFDRRKQLVPRTDAMPPEVIRALNARAALSVARDDATLAHLQSFGIAHAALGGCPSMLVSQLPQAHAPAMAVANGGTLLSVRNPRLMSVPLRDEARVHSTISRLIEALTADGRGPVRVLCHDTRDLEFASSLGPVDYLLPDDVYAYLDLLRRARLVVSFRLHAFVPCVSFGTPAVNISYDERSQSLMRTIGFADWDIDFLGAGDVVERVLDRCRRLQAYASLRDRSRALWDDHERTMRDAMTRFAGLVRSYEEDTP
jgi:hypothetical protein